MVSWRNAKVGDWVVWEPKNAENGRRDHFLGVVLELHISYTIVGSEGMRLIATPVDKTFRKARKHEIEDFQYRFFNRML